jgi:metal-sulfur cluster biosynthetic enzyme
MTTATRIDDAVHVALAGVHDPCSVARATPLSIVDMGLVLGWRFEEGTRTLHLDLTTTGPGCFLIQNIIGAIERRFEAIDAIERVLVRVHDRVWSPAMMSEEGKVTLQRRRSEAIARLSVTPQQWRADG